MAAAEAEDPAVAVDETSTPSLDSHPQDEDVGDQSLRLRLNTETRSHQQQSDAQPLVNANENHGDVRWGRFDDFISFWHTLSRRRVFILIVNFVALFCVWMLFLHVMREYQMIRMLKNSPSPSPFQQLETLPLKKEKIEKGVGFDVPRKKYEPPSEELQKIPFLKKTEDELYADQLRQMLLNLKDVVNRLDQGGNSTQLAGIIKMKPNQEPEEEVSFESFDDLDEGVFDDNVEHLVSSLTSPPPEKTAEESTPFIPYSKEISEILEYRRKYFERDREIEKLLGDGTRDEKLIEESEDRAELREELIIDFIDYFFKIESSDEWLFQVQREFYDGMSGIARHDRDLRLEAAIFGPEDLMGDGPDVIFRYKEENVYEEDYKTIFSRANLEKLHQMDFQQLLKFFVELKMILEVEKRMKEVVMEYARHHGDSS